MHVLGLERRKEGVHQRLAETFALERAEQVNVEMSRVAQVLPEPLAGAFEELSDRVSFSGAFKLGEPLIVFPQGREPLILHPPVEGTGITGSDDEAGGLALIVQGGETDLRFEEKYGAA